MSAFDWDGFDLLRGACEFAFPRIARGVKAGDAKAVVAGARSVLAVLGGCLPPAYASRVKSSLNLLPAVPAPFPPSAPVGDYAGVLQALDSVDRTMPPWGALGAVAGAVRMSLITARVTGPFDKLGSALLELTELGRELRTGAEGFKPPQAVADAAAKGLEYREKASPSNRGGLTPAEAGKQGIGSGVQRAVNLKNRDNVSAETISKMVAFFSRHEKNKGVAPEHKGKPWNDRGHVAWLLWGGDPGRTWAEGVKKQLDSKKTASHVEDSIWAGYGVAHKADLNPPLGVGGGPCLVVDRIRKRVRNPSLREGLIEEAESGELDNPSARKVYPLTEERGSLFKSFTITSHAQYRMDYRSITVADVTAALNNCAREFVRLSDEDPGRYDDLLNQDKITWLDPKTRLQLVFSLEGGTGEPVIISAYWKGQSDPPPAECPL